MVAQVGALVPALERLHGKHELPAHAHAVEPLQRLAVALHAQRRDVVEQHPHLHAACDRVAERVEERAPWCGRRRRCRTRRARSAAAERIAVGHRRERALVVADQARAVRADERHRAEVAVELHDPVEPPRPGRAVAHPLDAVRRLADELVDLRLLLAAVLGQLGIADQQEQQDAEDRDEEDGEQPRHARRRTAVARHDDDRDDADDEVDEDDRSSDDRSDLRRRDVDRHPAGRSRPSLARSSASIRA